MTVLQNSSCLSLSTFSPTKHAPSTSWKIQWMWGWTLRVPELSFWLWTKGQEKIMMNMNNNYLRTVSSRASAKGELHTTEAEAVNYESRPLKVALATLKMSIQPTVSCESFEITPLGILQLKCGLGLWHIGAHLAAIKGDTDSTDEEEEDVKLLSISGKPSFPQKWYQVNRKSKTCCCWRYLRCWF